MLKKAQTAAEDAAPHLIDHVDRKIQTLWQQMKDAFAKEFEKTLTKMKWPGKDMNLDGSLEHDWGVGVEQLLDLQEPYVKISILIFAVEIILLRIQMYCTVNTPWAVKMNYLPIFISAMIAIRA